MRYIEREGKSGNGKLEGESVLLSQQGGFMALGRRIICEKLLGLWEVLGTSVSLHSVAKPLKVTSVTSANAWRLSSRLNLWRSRGDISS